MEQHAHVGFVFKVAWVRGLWFNPELCSNPRSYKTLAPHIVCMHACMLQEVYACALRVVVSLCESNSASQLAVLHAGLAERSSALVAKFPSGPVAKGMHIGNTGRTSVQNHLEHVLVPHLFACGKGSNSWPMPVLQCILDANGHHYSLPTSFATHCMLLAAKCVMASPAPCDPWQHTACWRRSCCGAVHRIL